MTDKIIEELKRNDKSPKFYQEYPLLFKLYFPDLDEQTINKLSDIGYLYYHSILMLDELIDDKNIRSLPKMLMLQERAIKGLAYMFDGESEFWTYWETRKSEYFEAAQAEKKISNVNADWNTYTTISSKKAAFGKIAIDCLFVLSKRKSLIYNVLIESHDLFSIGFQLYDDVVDFKRDLHEGQFNWAVYNLMQNLEEHEAGLDVSELNKLFYVRGIASKILELSILYFEKALEVLLPFNMESGWTDTISQNKNIIKGYLENINGYLLSVITKTGLQNKVSTSNFLQYQTDVTWLQKGLDFIKSDFDRNYAELKHIMYLSKNTDGFENDTEIHYSDIFQRALINDYIFDIAQKKRFNCRSLIIHEIEYLLENQNKDIIGAWTYFPTVKEIAPDIDDLAQIIQLFVKTNNRCLIDKYCKYPIDIALDSKYNKCGGIGTWIIPNENRSSFQEKQIFFNETKWGCGPDVEVVANFIYALHLYDAKAYNGIISKAIDYIIRNQDVDGYWKSRWYYGNIYGTYICLRLLSQYVNKRTMTSVSICKDFLRYSQNKDGGYGLEANEESDMLSTAFALLCLKLFSEEFHNNIYCAELFLKQHQCQDGSWKATNFIKPKFEKPYKSKTLTTALVLKTLI